MPKDYTGPILIILITMAIMAFKINSIHERVERLEELHERRQTEMGKKWTPDDMDALVLYKTEATYIPVANTPARINLKKVYPKAFAPFNAVSIGTEAKGQIALVPLDEGADLNTAEYIAGALRLFPELVRTLNVFLEAVKQPDGAERLKKAIEEESRGQKLKDKLTTLTERKA